MNTLAPIEISHRAYSGSTKRFLDGMEVGDTRIAGSRLQVAAIYMQATRVLGWRVTRVPIGDGRYLVTRLDEAAYHDRMLSRQIIAELKLKPWQSVPQIAERLGVKYNSASCAVNRLFVDRKLIRSYITNPKHKQRKIYVYST